MSRARATRREFLQTVAAAAAVGSVAASSGCADTSWESFFQKHYRKLDEAEKRALIARLEHETRERYGVDVEITDPRPGRGVELGYALNLSLCIGCRQCEYACAAENNTSRDPEIHYIRVLEMDAASLDVDDAEQHYEGDVPRDRKFYMPVQCHQCRNPPCVRACPVQATWQEPDGVTVVDYDWCIGCRYCEAACPYFARRFGFAETSIRPSEINPVQSLLGNRIRNVGVVEKCHFCLQRSRNGRYPACLEACPVGARKFGNLRDPDSDIRRIIETKRVYVFKQDAGTRPRFYYYFG